MPDRLPQRPRFWIHRTRRFWFGLAGLVLLVASLLASGWNRIEVCHVSGRPQIDGSYLRTARIVGFRGGGLALSRLDLSYSLPPAPPANIGLSFAMDSHAGFGFLPGWSTPSGFHLLEPPYYFIPLWPLPVLWVIIWVARLVRADREEERRLQTSCDLAPR